NSCNKKNNNFLNNDKVISEEVFTQMLIKIHITDALLTKKKLSDKNLKKDSLSYYNHIFYEFDVSRAQFSYSLNYYIKNITKFVEIQNIVIDSLKTRFALIDSLDNIDNEKLDLWELKREWNLPDDGVTNTIPYNIKTNVQGSYTLSGDFFIHSDDLSRYIYMTITLYYSDKTNHTEKVRIFRKNKNTWKDFSVIIHSDKNKELTKVGGELLTHDEASTTYMHIDIKNIFLSCLEYKLPTDTVVAEPYFR
ncbi:MAG: DUF4296 domain-containing protein, partial [Bacteroidota bacterium]|nr:DUF4296 domain-containing protein [Bacteroidota bacterium]